MAKHLADYRTETLTVRFNEGVTLASFMEGWDVEPHDDGRMFLGADFMVTVEVSRPVERLAALTFIFDPEAYDPPAELIADSGKAEIVEVP